ncbi:hypothetical protein KXX41_006482 [Aspergillus fumigatus]|nr:hypothetical protein KXX41_006482 [Aspergillus fumigatus]
MPNNNFSSSQDTGVTGAAKFVTSTVGNTVGGVSRTVGGVTGAAARGVGGTITSATGSAGKPVGDALGSVGTGVEDAANRVAKGVEDAGQWRSGLHYKTATLQEHLASLKIILGIASFMSLFAMMSTSIEAVRRCNYRLFYITHSILAPVILIFLVLHAKSLRWYIVETLAVALLSLLNRLDAISAYATISRIPRTNLISVQIPIPASRIQRFRAAPGQHVYLSLHPETAMKVNSSLVQNLFLRNPFTVANVSENNEITLVARVQDGPTSRALDALADSAEKPSLLQLYGPFGSISRFSKLAMKYDRILIVAGGVGATFALPVYRELKEQVEAEGKGQDKITFVWSMKTLEEAAWAVGLADGQALTQEDNVKLYLTQSYQMRRQKPSPDDSVELEELQAPRAVVWPSAGTGRPDLAKIGDDLLGESDERVAVLFCGPPGMGRVLREDIGRYVREGREVWWHAEAFGW